MGKWTNQGLKVITQEEDLAKDDSQWAKDVKAKLVSLSGKSMTELVKRLNVVENRKDKLDALRGRMTAELRALEVRMLEELAKSGSSMWRGEGRTISPNDEFVAKVVDRDAFKSWIIATNQDDLLQVNSQTMTSLARQSMDPENVKLLTPAQRATLAPGFPGSGAPPPGVEVATFRSVSKKHTKKA